VADEVLVEHADVGRGLEEEEEEAQAKWGTGVPNPKRMGSTDEYARLAIAIAIADNDYINGEVIRIDGALRFSA
jgi:NAD(P)-dependent dehydrogenase (short-subunit alcohol dehydrogenase family)